MVSGKKRITNRYRKSQKQAKEDLLGAKAEIETNRCQYALELEAYKIQLEKIFEATVEGVMLITTSGKIIKANNAAASIFRTTQQKLERSTLLLPDWKLSHDVIILRSNGTVMPPEEMPITRTIKKQQVIKNQETGIQYSDGTIVWLNLSTAPIIEPEKNEVESVVFTFMDITTRKKVETELLEANEFNSTLLDNSPIPILAINPDTTISYANRAVEKVTGYSKEELTGVKAPYPFWKDRGKAKLGFVEDLTRDIKKGSQRVLRQFRSKSGKDIWIELTNIPIKVRGKIKYSLSNWVDVTEQKILSDEVEDYAHKVIRIQEEERKRIARELHDDTAQSLSMLSLELDSIINHWDIASDKTINKLKSLREITARSLIEVRRFSYELRPGILDHLGLTAALEQLVDESNKRGQQKVNLNIVGKERRLSNEAELVFFRITQEALNNIRKHSEASMVNITTRYSLSAVKLAISDNGKGFDVTKENKTLLKQGNMGLIGMRERAHLIGADFKIESQLGKGTRVSVTISDSQKKKH